MPLSPENVNELIQKRRSVYPISYIDKPIPKEIIEQILENANWAPNHRQTEPWRFIVFRGEGRKRLSEYLGNYYKENTPADKYVEGKYQKTLEKPMQSSCVIAICMQRDEAERVPEWEEIAATAAAVQNMYLTCTAYGIGCYWSSPKSIIEGSEFLKLEKGQRCLGLFYMGYHNQEHFRPRRKPVENKTRWEE
jgi:nitroreductase